MNAIAQFFARRRQPAIGGAGIDPRREGGFVASHYRYFRNRRGMGARAALEAALELPAAYVKGREYYGPTGGAGAPNSDGLRWIESTDACGLRFVGDAAKPCGPLFVRRSAPAWTPCWKPFPKSGRRGSRHGVTSGARRMWKHGGRALWMNRTSCGPCALDTPAATIGTARRRIAPYDGPH